MKEGCFRLIGIVGGIGAGKSVVQHIMLAMGYPVYDCDIKARTIMDSNAQLKAEIADNISADAIDCDGKIDRKILAQVVFNDPAKLKKLNTLVHSLVIADLRKWAHDCNSEIAFVETAILYQSGLDRIVDEVWEITAPIDLRIERVMQRNGLRRDEVKKRIEAQGYLPEKVHGNIKEISNDGLHSLLIQINSLLYFQSI